MAIICCMLIDVFVLFQTIYDNATHFWMWIMNVSMLSFHLAPIDNEQSTYKVWQNGLLFHCIGKRKWNSWPSVHFNNRFSPLFTCGNECTNYCNELMASFNWLLLTISNEQIELVFLVLSSNQSFDSIEIKSFTQ